MFQRVQHFADLWLIESAATRRVLSRLTDGALSVRVAPEARSAGETAWHIAGAIRDIGAGMALPLSGPKRGDPVPGEAEEIMAAYARAADELWRLVTTDWSDETLREQDDVYGARWERGHTLYILLAHEIHHRGQLTTLLRVAGLTIPWVYGPSQEVKAPPAPPS
jgi:uncharacterized damage-inducible protein DinB